MPGMTTFGLRMQLVGDGVASMRPRLNAGDDPLPCI